LCLMKWHRRDRRARKSKRKTLFIFLVVKVKVLYSKSTDLLIMGSGWS
jgi:hypothetical protein